MRTNTCVVQRIAWRDTPTKHATPVATMCNKLAPQKVTQGLFHDLPTHFGNGLGEWNVFGANFDAVLGVTAFLDAAIAHESCQSFALQRFAGGMRVEQTHLGDRRRPNEIRSVVELRTGFHATAARNAAR